MPRCNSPAWVTAGGTSYIAATSSGGPCGMAGERPHPTSLPLGHLPQRGRLYAVLQSAPAPPYSSAAMSMFTPSSATTAPCAASALSAWASSHLFRAQSMRSITLAPPSGR